MFAVAVMCVFLLALLRTSSAPLTIYCVFFYLCEGQYTAWRLYGHWGMRWQQVPINLRPLIVAAVVLGCSILQLSVAWTAVSSFTLLCAQWRASSSCYLLLRLLRSLFLKSERGYYLNFLNMHICSINVRVWASRCSIHLHLALINLDIRQTN